MFVPFCPVRDGMLVENVCPPVRPSPVRDGICGKNIASLTGLKVVRNSSFYLFIEE